MKSPTKNPMELRKIIMRRSFKVNAEHNSCTVNVFICKCMARPVIEFGVPKRFGSHSKPLSLQFAKYNLDPQFVSWHFEL